METDDFMSHSLFESEIFHVTDGYETVFPTFASEMIFKNRNRR